MDFLNVREFLPSPVTVTKNLRIEIGDLNMLKRLCLKALEVLNDAFLPLKEVKVLDKYFYVARRRKRSSKEFAMLKKIRKMVLRCFEINLPQIFKDLLSVCSECLTKPSEYLYAPPKEIIQYILLRLQGFATLNCYLVVECEALVSFFKTFGDGGYSQKDVLFCVSSASRIWYCSKFFALCACRFYSEILPFLSKLDPCGDFWLPKDYSFPRDLISWLESNPKIGKEILKNANVNKVFKVKPEVETVSDIGEVISRKAYAAMQKTTSSYPTIHQPMSLQCSSGGNNGEVQKEYSGTKSSIKSQKQSVEAGKICKEETALVAEKLAIMKQNTFVSVKSRKKKKKIRSNVENGTVSRGEKGVQSKIRKKKLKKRSKMIVSKT